MQEVEHRPQVTDGEETESEAEAITRLAALAADAGFIDDFSAVVETTLGNTDDMLAGMLAFTNALKIYVGDQDTALVAATIAAYGLDNAELDEELALLDDEQEAVLRRFASCAFARHSELLRLGFTFLNSDNDNWQWVNIEAQYGLKKAQWSAKIEIFKYSGERILFSGPAVAWLRLANNLLGLIVEIGEEAETLEDIVDRESVDTLHDLVSSIDTYFGTDTGLPPAVDLGD